MGQAEFPIKRGADRTWLTAVSVYVCRLHSFVYSYLFQYITLSLMFLPYRSPGGVCMCIYVRCMFGDSRALCSLTSSRHVSLWCCSPYRSPSSSGGEERSPSPAQNTKTEDQEIEDEIQKKTEEEEEGKEKEDEQQQQQQQERKMEVEEEKNNSSEVEVKGQEEWRCLG